MNGTIVFCKDGVLRLQAPDERVAVPMTSIQSALELPPHRLFMQYLCHSALIEKGSTVGSFLLCLEPWAEEASDLTDRRVDLYIAELRKPSTEVGAYDRVEIHPRIDVQRALVHEPIPDDVDLFEWFNRPKELVWSDSFGANLTYDICGYRAGEPENWSVSSCPIHQLKNVPLVINRDTLITEHQSNRVPKTPLINREAEGVQTVDGGSICFASIELSNEVTMFDLIDTVVSHGLWFSSPRGAQAERDAISAAMENLKLVKDEGEGEGEDEVHEGADPQSDSGVKKVVVAPGAFDGLARSIKRERDEWDDLMDKVDSHATPIRIGAIDEDVPSDKRVRGYIVTM